MKRLLSSLLVLLCCVCFAGTVRAADREFYALHMYNYETPGQEQAIDRYLEQAYLPALRRHGFSKLGVFKPIANDTAAIKRIVVLVPFRRMDQFTKLADQLATDKAYQAAAAPYLEVAYDQPNYKRMETILLRAFSGMAISAKPALKSAHTDKIYELRSYEAPSEKLYWNKVDMFNKGDEIGLFKRLGFNAVFYGEVLAGSHMPNLMYLTSFENMNDRNEHWKTFGNDPQWKALLANTTYLKGNVSRNDTWLMKATAYSEL